MKHNDILPGMIIHTISGNEFVVTKKPINMDVEVKTFEGELITKITYGRETVYKGNPIEISQAKKSIWDEYLIADRQNHGGIQKIYKFENDRGASVIRNPFSYGGEKGLYELAVLDNNGNLDYTTPITNDVIGWLTWEEVIELLRKIKELENE